MRRAERRRRMKAHRRAERNRADEARRRQPREIRWVYPQGDFEPIFQTIERFDRLVDSAIFGHSFEPVNSGAFFGASSLREAYRRWSLMTDVFSQGGLYWELSPMRYMGLRAGDAPQGGAT